MVIRLEQCLARPPHKGQSFLLQEHLEAVAFDCGNVKGSLEEILAFLAGLLHDSAKSHPLWQEYIVGNREKGPAHSPLGAALFAFFADRLIDSWGLGPNLEQGYYDLTLDWARVIYNHHGKLQDLESEFPPWEKSGGGSAQDLNGLEV